MRFSFTPEQEEFRSSLRRALEARSPTKEVRRLMATDQGFERDGWKKLNQELGLTAIHIPEAYGGSGFGQGDLAIVLEEMGRGLLCAPFLSTVLAANAILNAGTDEQKRALLPAIASGETDRDAGLLRGRRAQRRRGRRHDGHAIRRHLAARGHQELRARRPYRRPHRRAGAPAGLAGRGRPVVLHRRRRCRRAWSASGSRPWTRRASSRGSPSTRSRRGSWARPAPPRHPSPAPCSRRPSCSPTRWWAAPSGCARTRSPTPRCACSSAARSPRSRRPRTRRPTCWSMSSWRSRRPTTPPPRSTRATTICRPSPRSPRPAPPRPICRPPSMPCRCMAASASPGTTTRISGSSGPRAREILFGDANQHRELMMQHWKH